MIDSSTPLTNYQNDVYLIRAWSHTFRDDRILSGYLAAHTLLLLHPLALYSPIPHQRLCLACLHHTQNLKNDFGIACINRCDNIQ